MNIFEHFACHTHLPIRLDTVCDQAMEYGYVHAFKFMAAPIDLRYLSGMFLMRETVANGDIRRIADIYYSDQIVDEAYRRLVCCKEILHALDDDKSSAQSQRAISNLIDQIVIPLDADVPPSVASDHFGILHALMVLLPRDALNILRPLHRDNVLSVEDIATIAAIPTNWTRFALSDAWESVIESIT